MNNPMRYIDPLGTDTVHVNPDGTPQRYPDGSIIRHPGGETVLIQDQPLPEVVIEGKRILKPSNGTVAIGHNYFTFDGQAGYGYNITESKIVILKGLDAGKVLIVESSTENISGLGVSISGGKTYYSYHGDINNFTSKLFLGGANTQETSMGVVVNVGFSTNTTFNGDTGEKLVGRSFSIGLGAGLPMNVSSGTSQTRQYRPINSIYQNGKINFFR
jgi:hypothetical protein